MIRINLLTGGLSETPGKTNAQIAYIQGYHR